MNPLLFLTPPLLDQASAATFLTVLRVKASKPDGRHETTDRGGHGSGNEGLDGKHRGGKREEFFWEVSLSFVNPDAGSQRAVSKRRQRVDVRFL